MALFKRRKSKPALDAPGAVERMRTEILVAVGRAEACGVGPGAIADVLQEVIGCQRYIASVSGRSSYHTTSEIVHIGP